MEDVTDASFDQAVLRSPRPVVVDFWAPWCRPCSAIEPILEELAERVGARVAFARLNADGNPETTARYEVMALPTVIAFVHGAAAARVVGARRRSAYERLLAEVLPAAGANGGSA